ncbi:MAG: hypothetical protein IK133_10375 [Clostridia bacterium]|nr:hypothetical protein [Clostridia bacterium]
MIRIFRQSVIYVMILCLVLAGTHIAAAEEPNAGISAEGDANVSDLSNMGNATIHTNITITDGNMADVSFTGFFSDYPYADSATVAQDQTAVAVELFGKQLNNSSAFVIRFKNEKGFNNVSSSTDYLASYPSADSTAAGQDQTAVSGPISAANDSSAVSETASVIDLNNSTAFIDDRSLVGKNITNNTFTINNSTFSGFLNYPGSSSYNPLTGATGIAIGETQDGGYTMNGSKVSKGDLTVVLESGYVIKINADPQTVSLLAALFDTVAQNKDSVNVSADSMNSTASAIPDISVQSILEMLGTETLSDNDALESIPIALISFCDQEGKLHAAVTGKADASVHGAVETLLIVSDADSSSVSVKKEGSIGSLALCANDVQVTSENKDGIQSLLLSASAAGSVLNGLDSQIAYVWSSTHEACTAVIQFLSGEEIVASIPVAEATVSSVDTEPASCAAAGTRVYTATFTDPTFATQEYPEEITKVAHQLKYHKEKAPTCTEWGKSEYWSCSTCGGMFKDDKGTIPIKGPTSYAANGHKLDRYARVDATCTTAGTEAYWKCSVCGGFFSDSAGKNKISEPASIAIDPNNHLYVEVEPAVDATCEEPGFTALYRCSVHEDAEKGGDMIDPLGHEFVNGVCKRCGAEESGITVEPTD